MQEPELLEQVLKAQGGHEGLGDLYFRNALLQATASMTASSANKTGSTTLRVHDLALSDTLRLLEHASDAWGQVSSHVLGCADGDMLPKPELMCRHTAWAHLQ